MKPTLQLLGGLVIATTCACAPAVRGAAKNASETATPIVIDETLRTLEDQKTGDRIATIVGSPEIERAVGELGSSLIRGRLDDPEIAAQIERLSAELTRTMIEAIRAEFGDLSPAIRLTVRRAVADATREVTLVLAEDVPSRLAPAMRSAVTTQLEEPELRKALSSTAREIAKQAVIGSQEAMAAENQGTQIPPGVLFRASRLLQTANQGVLFAMVVATIVLALWAWRRRRDSSNAARDSEPPVFL